jgi:CysZ protein
MINVLLFIGMFFLLRHYVGEFNHWFAGLLPAWLHWLSAILWLLFIISFFLVFICTFVSFANLLSAPFSSLLAEKVELYLTGTVLEERSVLENIKDVPRIIARQLSILGYYVPRALLILILFFVPVMQAVAAVIWFLFNAWFMTLQYVDFPTDNHRISIRDVRNWLEQRRWLSLGFGVGVLVVSMIPVLNFFVIPAAVAGATKLWVSESKTV